VAGFGVMALAAAEPGEAHGGAQFPELGPCSSAITPGLAVVANAIVDALSEFGIEHIELPATPERIWNAIRTSPSHN
jgi:CO/xanthine dehydrogenase Mo-binding subunit